MNATFNRGDERAIESEGYSAEGTYAATAPSTATSSATVVHRTASSKRLSVSFFCATVAIMLLALAAVSIPPTWADSIFASGTGTTADPYIIETAEQLEAFRDSVNAGTTYEGNTIQITADIDISAKEWTPIGAGVRSGSGAGTGSTPFKGIIDGTDHTITGLSISTIPTLGTSTTANPDYALGFIGVLDGGQVKNLSFKDVNINVPSSKLAGGAVGLAINDAAISNISVAGSLNAQGGVGGIVGRMTISGTITDCTNEATITAGTGGNAGGIVGAAYYTSLSGQMVIDGCQNSGAINGSQAIGGIAGLDSAFVNDCTNTGAITASNYSAGGIVGEQKNYGAVHRSTNEGTVTTTSTSGYGTGGIVGWARFDGAATAYPASSPIAITDNTNKAAIKGGNDAGGIVGTFYDAGIVTNNTNEAPSLAGTAFAGGIVGNLQSSGTTLPTGVTEGIRVENNVSTTPLADITATNKDLYAYNNTPSKFTVDDNGTAWVAQTNSNTFATVARAVKMATGGGTVTLIADVPDAGTVTANGTGTTILDLNGHNITFEESPAFVVSSGDLVMTQTGKVFTDGTALSDLIAASPSNSTTKSAAPALELEGGTYTQDVDPYVADGYAELVHHGVTDGARYEVLPEQEAKADAVAYVTVDGRKPEYFMNLDDAKAAQEALPGSTLTLMDSKPDEGTTPEGSGTTTVPPANEDGSNANKNPLANENVKTLEPIAASSSNTGGDLARTGDDAWLFVAIALGAMMIAGGMAILTSRRGASK